MHDPLISIVVPVYQVEKYLADCLDSILQQTYSNLEILLIDDGSKDRSGEICDHYAEMDHRVRVIHKQNGGLSDARNTGIQWAKGDYLCFVDSDDILHPRFVEGLFSHIGQADMAFCDQKPFIDTAEIQFEPIDHWETQEFEAEKLILNITTFKYPLVVLPWNKLYRSRIWRNLRYPDKKIHEDEFVVHEVLHLCHHVKFVNLPLYYHRLRADSIMSKASEACALLDKMEALFLRRQFFLSKGKYAAARELNEEILFRCLLSPVKKDNPVWNRMSMSDIIFKNKLLWRYRLLLVLKRQHYGLYVKILQLHKWLQRRTKHT